ncbi:uncharacterized protein LOC133835268 [Drosophila sulfurigaster albostrigata]|uniref:uncharacterized protein LOC133835268 n=1 Tax=Drosophila sulfurigaster albostrigata TaxID=89887 RepID=UPI002D218D42|nr:uncharacterized protein LOC133835268 [Drosophila sulfurigaster albostrigata]
MAKSSCTGALKPAIVYQKLMVENLTVVRPPILKIYYWESFDITGLNKKLRSNKKEHEHVLTIPIRQIQSQPLKMIFWLRNMSAKPLNIKLRRIQNCQCQPQQTRVGFNQFQKLFHCPHRRLINVSQEILNMQPDEVLPLSVTAQFYLYGEHYLTYELTTGDERKFEWSFKLQISEFDLEKCLLTNELLPINIKQFQHITQPIWVQNITMAHLSFAFSSRERNCKLHNSNLTVPRQSVWPLLIEYRPLDYDNEIEGNCEPCGGVGTDVVEGAGGDGLPTTPTAEQQKAAEREELVKRLSNKRKLNANEIIELSMAIDHRITIFEKLFCTILYTKKKNFIENIIKN